MNEALESMPETPVHYESYLLRVWRTKGGSRRWLLEQVVTGERHAFTNLPDLVLFLRDETIPPCSETRRAPSRRSRTPRQARRPVAADSPEE